MDQVLKTIFSFCYLLIILVCIGTISHSISGCAFATDAVYELNKTVQPTDTKYKVIHSGPCSYKVNFVVNIDYGYEHYKNSLHHGSVRYSKREVATFGSWNELSVVVPCGACQYDLTGVVSVLDQKINLMPWGCGQERPPLSIQKIHSSFVDTYKKGLEDWGDDKPKEYNHEYYPNLVSDLNVCDGLPVVIDLNDTCEVLVQAGVLEKN